MVVQDNEFPYIRRLTTNDEKRMRRIPYLNIDSLLIPSPYIRDKSLDIDNEHSYVWEEEGEFLGYFLVYSDPDKSKFHIYKQVTSPFGRGKGIGSAFIEKLANEVPPESRIYLYVWEKLSSSIDFFQSKGFNFEESIVYRKMKFHLMSAGAGDIADKLAESKNKDYSEAEELGKVRHDAKKALKILLDMVSMLSVDNFKKVIEDINRETTALFNTLNTYEDKIASSHEVHIKELITERVIPFIEAADLPCEIRLILQSRVPPVIGNYLNFSRALINIVSNSLDAIRESGRRGCIEVNLAEKDDTVNLVIQDNGIGIDEERLAKGPDLIPLFVGKTTKEGKTGEGIGTRQIFSTFGPGNITVESKRDEFTRWAITLKKRTRKESILLSELKSRYVEFIKATERIGITESSSRTSVSSFIWHLRQMEIFSYELVCHFSRYNNVRDIYRAILAYRYGGKDFEFLKTELKKCRIDNEVIKSWLLGTTRRIMRNETYLAEHFDFDEYKGVLFKSYGQAVGCTMIFTMDPETGHFLATDRKLAEHMDFVPYLSRKRDRLLRGEFVGDLRVLASPVWLGAWSVANLQDLHDRLALIREGAWQLLKMGLKYEKRLSFYATTYNSSNYEIDTLKTVTLGDMAAMKDNEFDQLIVSSEDELHGMVFAD
ncbi:MAG: GNAT family N-acetyltransferase [Deltaproteobacteria bacterium]|nr:GNAT family N-acetyltransferase [Deltaproteobacteria bacterium]